MLYVVPLDPAELFLKQLEELRLGRRGLLSQWRVVVVVVVVVVDDIESLCMITAPQSRT